MHDFAPLPAPFRGFAWQNFIHQPSVFTSVSDIPEYIFFTNNSAIISPAFSKLIFGEVLPADLHFLILKIQNIAELIQTPQLTKRIWVRLRDIFFGKSFQQLFDLNTRHITRFK